MYNVFEVILFGLMTSLVQADNCPYKECDCVGKKILCSYYDFKVIPQKLYNSSPSLASLHLDGNQITTIPAGSLPANLSGISLESDPIENIDDTAFDENIYTLQELIFTEAHFTQIPQAVFHLKALKNLQIFQTNISMWNEDGMEQLGLTLEKLSLGAVGLTSWPTWMKSMTNLTELTIAACSIFTIPDDALDMMANTLTSLQLSNNGLTTLPKSMSNLTNLITLTLSYNKIIDVTWLPQSTHLITLSLDSNKIKYADKISNGLRACAKTITNLDIHNNSLTSIPDLSFLTKIEFLNFDFNHLTDANSGSFSANVIELDFGSNLLSSIPTAIRNLKQLTELSLNSNNIQFFQGTQLPTSVQMLDLSYNSISQLTSSSFPKNSSLIILTLNNNPLFSIPADTFINIPFLTQLNLKSTKLTRLPLAVASLRKLSFLDVTNSESLVCTCQEQSLQSFILTLGLYGVVGDCGVTSVYLFFTTLSPECPKMM